MSKKLSEDHQHLTALAAQILMEYGWVQNAYGNESEGFCAVGALNQAQRFIPSNLLDIFYETESKIGDIALTVWNDSPDRIKEDVAALLQDLGEGR